MRGGIKGSSEMIVIEMNCCCDTESFVFGVSVVNASITKKARGGEIEEVDLGESVGREIGRREEERGGKETTE
jgi:hypothetical protein